MSDGAKPTLAQRFRALSLRGKLFFALAQVLVLLLVLEVVCRLATEDVPAQARAGFVEPDPELIWRLKPIAEGPLKTNELGLRDTRYKANADVKVLLLGDSISWGDGVLEVRQCWPQELERLLAAADGVRSYEVVNAGVPGYSTFQEARYLELHGLALEPDLVLLQFCLNDVVERYQTLARYGGDGEFLGIDTRSDLPGPLGFLVRHSRAVETVVRFAQRRARKREAYDVQQLAHDELAPELTAAWALALEELESIRRTASERGLPLVLVLAPYQFQLADPEHTRQPQERLLAWAAEHGVPCVDLLPGFVATARDPASPGVQLFHDVNHFSVAGHALAARLALDAVRAALP